MKSYFLAGLLLLPPFSAPIRAFDKRPDGIICIGAAISSISFYNLTKKDIEGVDAICNTLLFSSGVLTIMLAYELVKNFDSLKR